MSRVIQRTPRGSPAPNKIANSRKIVKSYTLNKPRMPQISYKEDPAPTSTTTDKQTIINVYCGGEKKDHHHNEHCGNSGGCCPYYDYLGYPYYPVSTLLTASPLAYYPPPAPIFPANYGCVPQLTCTQFPQIYNPVCSNFI